MAVAYRRQKERRRKAERKPVDVLFGDNEIDDLLPDAVARRSLATESGELPDLSATEFEALCDRLFAEEESPGASQEDEGVIGSLNSTLG